MRKEEKHTPPPLLLTIHGEGEHEKQSLYNLLDNRICETTRHPVLTNKTVLGSAYGWFVLLDNSEGDSKGDCCLWNPASTKIIQLPNLDDDDPSLYTRCLLSSPPSDPYCFIVFDRLSCTKQIYCWVNEASVFHVNNEELGYYIIARVSFRGSVYAVANNLFEFPPHEVVSVHADDDGIEVRPLLINGQWGVPELSLRSWAMCPESFLIQSPCGNELLLVTRTVFGPYQDSGVQFRIFRLDVISTMVCEELENLDGKTVFISYYGNGFCCYSESVGRAIKPNSIYYTDSNGMDIHVYDLDDRSSTTLLPFTNLENIDLNSSTSYWVDLPSNNLDLSLN